MLKIAADLHIHSILSPCADSSMVPEKIFCKAREMGLDLLGITDHNSAENVSAFINVAKDYNIKILPGMEVQTREDIHLLTYFTDLSTLMQWQEIVYKHLPFIKNNPSIYGDEYLLDSLGSICGNLEKLLLISITMNIQEVFQEVVKLKGICIPAHVDRPRYGMLGQLGYFPSKVLIEGAEVSPLYKNNDSLKDRMKDNNIGIICSSDAHFIEDIGKGRTLFNIKEISLPEIILALKGEKGRWTEVLI